MSTPRLTSAMMAGAILRAAGQAGGFAAVVAKGDPTAGSILLHFLEKGLNFGAFERVLDSSGHYCWSRTGPQATENIALFFEFLDRRRARDPDLWVLELDIPDAERFIADSLPNP